MRALRNFSSVDSVAGGAAAALSPLISAGFNASKVQDQTKYAGKMFEIEQRKQELYRLPSYLPPSREGTSVLAFVFLGIGVVIALIVALVVFTSKVSSGGGRQIRVIRKPKDQTR